MKKKNTLNDLPVVESLSVNNDWLSDEVFYVIYSQNGIPIGRITADSNRAAKRKIKLDRYRQISKEVDKLNKEIEVLSGECREISEWLKENEV